MQYISDFLKWDEILREYNSCFVSSQLQTCQISLDNFLDKLCVPFQSCFILGSDIFLDAFNFCVQYLVYDDKKETAFECRHYKYPGTYCKVVYFKGYCQVVSCSSICGTKTKTVPLKTVSAIHFSLFQLETENSLTVGHIWFSFRK